MTRFLECRKNPEFGVLLSLRLLQFLLQLTVGLVKLNRNETNYWATFLNNDNEKPIDGEMHTTLYSTVVLRFLSLDRLLFTSLSLAL